MGLSSFISFIGVPFQHTWLYGDLVTNLSAPDTRNVFTTGSTVLSAALAYLGGLYVKRRNQRHLLSSKRNSQYQHQSISINHLTPWMSLSGTISYTWATRSLPGGMLGLLMIAMGSFSLSSHYFVNSFIEPFPVQRRCDFTVGLNTTLSDGSFGAIVDWPAATLAMLAQQYALYNGADMGVYDKIINGVSIDGSSPLVSSIWPDPVHDVLGSWTCSNTSLNTIGSTDLGNITTIDAYLIQQGIQSDSADSGSERRVIGTGQSTGFLAWSTGDGLSSNQSIQSLPPIRVSISDGLDTLGPGENGTVTTMTCVMHVNRQSWIPPVQLFQNGTLLQAWTSKAIGSVLDTDPASWNYTMALLLNTMVMTAGGGNRVDTLPLQSSDYGCAQSGSLIKWQMWLITALLIGTLATLLVLDLYGLWFSHSNVRWMDVEQLPSDVLNWQMAMIQQMTRGGHITEKEVRSYRYGLIGDSGRLEIRKSDTSTVSIASQP